MLRKTALELYQAYNVPYPRDSENIRSMVIEAHVQLYLPTISRDFPRTLPNIEQLDNPARKTREGSVWINADYRLFFVLLVVRVDGPFWSKQIVVEICREDLGADLYARDFVMCKVSQYWIDCDLKYCCNILTVFSSSPPDTMQSITKTASKLVNIKFFYFISWKFPTIHSPPPFPHFCT